MLGSGVHTYNPIGQLTHTRRSDVVPDPDGVLKETVRIKIRHSRRIYLNHPDLIAFMPLVHCRRNRSGSDFFVLLVWLI